MKKYGRSWNNANKQWESIIKVIKSLENLEILLKGTTKNVVNQKGGFLSNVVSSLMKVGLPYAIS